MTDHPTEPHPMLANEEDCEGLARAALLPLRDLTPDVVEAGGIAADHAPLAEEARTFGEAYRPVARAAFTAMINTIIGERG